MCTAMLATCNIEAGTLHSRRGRRAGDGGFPQGHTTRNPQNQKPPGTKTNPANPHPLSLRQYASKQKTNTNASPTKPPPTSYAKWWDLAQKISQLLNIQQRLKSKRWKLFQFRCPAQPPGGGILLLNSDITTVTPNQTPPLPATTHSILYYKLA